MGYLPAALGLATLDGANGFRIDAEAARDSFAFRVAPPADVNRDGLDDFIVSAPGVDASCDSSGAAYVVFDRSGRFPAAFNAASLNGASGFRIDGAAAHRGGLTRGPVTPSPAPPGAWRR